MTWSRITQSLFFNVFFLIVAASVSYSAVYMVMQARDMKKESVLLDAEIIRLQKEKTDLEAAIAELKTPHAAEREAKERLNLKWPGEEVAVILSEPGKEKTEEQKSTFLQSVKKWIFR